MAYEYENTVVAELTSLGMQYNSNAHYEMAGEVEDVYAKAKAFNEIKERIYYENLAWTDEGYYDGYHERIGNITVDVIDKYDNQMEDE